MYLGKFAEFSCNHLIIDLSQKTFNARVFAISAVTCYWRWKDPTYLAVRRSLSRVVELDRRGFEYEFYLQHRRRPDLMPSRGFAFRAKVDRARRSSNEPRSLLHYPSVNGAWVRKNLVSEKSGVGTCTSPSSQDLKSLWKGNIPTSCSKEQVHGRL